MIRSTMATSLLRLTRTSALFVYAVITLGTTANRSFAAHLRDTVVYPRIIDARNDGNVKVLHVRSDLIFNLEPASVLGDTITVMTDNSNRKEVDTDYLKKRLYQDVENSASLYLEDTDAGILTEGVLGNELRIEPIRDVSARQDGAIPHRIFEIDGSADYSGDTVELDSTELEPQPERLLTERSSQKMPAAVYVNISVLVDSFLDKGLKKLNRSVLTYVAVFMNGVNLKYAQFDKPRFLLKLRVIQSLSDTLEAKQLNISGSMLNFKAVTNALRTFVARPDFNDSAAVFMMSGRDVASGPDRKAFGVAFVAQLCTQYKFGVGEDIPGTYFGIAVAAHEILHIVGAVHDGAPPRTTYQGDPGAKSCPVRKHLMSPFASTKVVNSLSNCTQKQVRFHLNRRGPSCWKPLHDQDLAPPMLPGSNFSASMFCSLANKEKYTDGKLDDDCRINCTTKKKTSEYFVGLDGMECRSNRTKVCVKGVCMPKNNIPKTPPYGGNVTSA
uniref:Putative secreted metalloprotease n=1 Tax=Ornithodoros turicata TaxID=34597 RepID=A0A2R5L5L8_9ACAR